MTTEFIAEGRIVWGHPGKPQIKTDPKTKEVKLHKTTGQPIEQYVFGLAIPKESFNANVWPSMHAEGASAFPNGTPPNFSWKFKDGDTDVDGKGNPYSGYEGRAGCMILTVSTESFAPALLKMNPTSGKYEAITADQLKCGDYVAVKIDCKFNGATGLNTPGVYVNPKGIIHVGYGTEIVSSGFDADEAFAGFVPTLPSGATAQPTLSDAAPLPAGMAAPQPAPVAAVEPVAAAIPAPAHDYVAQATGQVAQPVPAAPGVPIAPVAAAMPPPPMPAAAPVPGVPVAAVPGQPQALPGVPGAVPLV